MKNKNILFLFLLFFLSINIQAQTWQDTFQVNGTPIHLEEVDNGDLHVHCYNSTDSVWFKLITNNLGDSIGIEYYTPAKKNYHTIETTSGNQMLTYWDTLDNLIWEVPISVSSNTSVATSNDGLAVLIYYYQSGIFSSGGTIWVYDQQGNLTFNEVATGQNPIKGWYAKLKLDGTILLLQYSSSGSLPQGASNSYSFLYLLDSLGNTICSESGYSYSNYYNTRAVHDLAANGLGECGAVGIQEQGLYPSNPNIESGQFIPCTNFIIPYDMVFPSDVEMIGLQDDAYAILGYEDEKINLTRIGCDLPLELAYCWDNQTSNSYEYICEGEILILYGDTLHSGYNYITTTDSYGCDSFLIIDLTIIPSSPDADPIVNTINNVSSIDLNTDCPQCTYLWSNGATEEEINNLPPGNYSVTITSWGDCEYYYDFEIEMQLQLELSTVHLPPTKRIDGWQIYPSIIEKEKTVHIEIEEFVLGDKHFEIRNISGKKIDEFNFSDESKFSFQSPKNAGVYFIYFYKNNKIDSVRKLIVM